MGEVKIMEMVVAVRYGELFLKSEPVKRRFIGILIGNIERALQKEGVTFHIEYPRGRIIIHGDETETIAKAAARIFGVVDTSICSLTDSTPKDLAHAAITMAGKHLFPGMTFAVRAKRQQKEGMSSPDLAAFVGSEICKHIPGLTVNLDHPQYELFVEVREIGSLVCDQRFSGPGGLPFGTQGHFLSLLSSGIDSPVAAWMMMKRGCIPNFLFLDTEIWGGEDVRKGALENLRRLSLWCPGHSLELDVIPVGELYDRMNEKKIPPRFRCVICKRFMYRLGSAYAEKKEALVLVTGENLGQVASQTLVNLATISEAATVPVLRPLITYDKIEIIEKAREIGTFPGPGGDLSCRAVPHKPSTGADLRTVKTLEERLDIPSLITNVSYLSSTLMAKDGQIRKKNRDTAELMK